MVAIRIGLKPWEFDDLTLYEFNLIVKDYTEKRKEKQDTLLTQGWLVAMFNRYNHSGEALPDLDKFINAKEETTTIDSMIDIAKKITSNFGGKVEVIE